VITNDKLHNAMEKSVMITPPIIASEGRSYHTFIRDGLFSTVNLNSSSSYASRMNHIFIAL